MEYIPSFVKRKHGDEQIIYDLPDCEKLFKRNLWNNCLSRAGNAFVSKISWIYWWSGRYLRKAMGKKDKATLDKMKPIICLVPLKEITRLMY